MLCVPSINSVVNASSETVLQMQNGFYKEVRSSVSLALLFSWVDVANEGLHSAGSVLGAQKQKLVSALTV